MSNITAEQALENLARIADDYPLKGPDRRLINESIAVLAEKIKPAEDKAPVGAAAVA